MTIPTQSPETGLREALAKLATKQDGYGMAYHGRGHGLFGNAEIHLYGDRAEAVRWLMEHGLAALAERPAVEREAGSLKDAVCELLSHRGERPYRVLRGGQELWETWLPAFEAATRYLPSRPEPVVDHIGGLMDPLFAPEPVVDGAAEVRFTEEDVEAVAMAIASAWASFGEVPFPLYDREARKLAAAAIRALPDHVGGVETGHG